MVKTSNPSARSVLSAPPGKPRRTQEKEGAWSWLLEEHSTALSRNLAPCQRPVLLDKEPPQIRRGDSQVVITGISDLIQKMQRNWNLTSIVLEFHLSASEDFYQLLAESPRPRTEYSWCSLHMYYLID